MYNYIGLSISLFLLTYYFVSIYYYAIVLNHRMDWIHKGKLEVTSVPGKHSVHMENAPLVASKIIPWILAQDVGQVAKL
jgi:hypothetical protein